MDFLISAVEAGIIIAFVILSLVAIITTICFMGASLGEPFGVLIYNCIPAIEQDIQRQYRESSSNTYQPKPRTPEQQRRLIQRLIGGSIAISLCLVGIIFELSQRNTTPMAGSGEPQWNAWVVGTLVTKGCLEGIVALSVLRLVMVGYNFFTR